MLETSSSSAVADLIIVNGKIITVDPRDTIAEAVAICSGRILHVSSKRQILEYAKPETKVIDLEGKAVTPRLTDDHALVLLGAGVGAGREICRFQ